MGLDQDHEQWVLMPDTTTLGHDARLKAKAFSRGSSDPLAWVCSHVCGSGLNAQDSQDPLAWVSNHACGSGPDVMCLQIMACNPTWRVGTQGLPIPALGVCNLGPATPPKLKLTIFSPTIP